MQIGGTVELEQSGITTMIQIAATPRASTISAADALAVASACAASLNELAIPCHLVVRSNNDLAGYRGGIERKHKLVCKEAMT